MNFFVKATGLFLNALAVFLPRKAGQLGFTLLCRPFRGKIARRHRDFFESANPFKLQHGNDTIQGYQWGNGPQAILFLHGWQSHSYYWKNHIETLDQSQYTLYAIDAPGHGLSTGEFLTMPLYSDVVRSVLQHIGPVHCVVGHSIGGLTAIYTFYKHPALSPAKLITLSSPGRVQEFFDAFEKQLGLTRRCVQHVIARFEEMVRKPTAYYSAFTFAESLEMPGLLIHDQGDQNTPVENARAIHSKWKNSTLLVTDGNDHNLRSPDVVKMVTDFVVNDHSHLHLLDSR